MASISSVITGGFGAPGSAALVITDGFGTSGTFIPPVVTQDAPSGVRRARYLRRASKGAPKLPWEQDEPQVTIAPPKRKRIQLPPAKVQEALGPIPIQTVREISAPVISIPDVGTAVLDDDDDDLMLWLI